MLKIDKTIKESFKNSVNENDIFDLGESVIIPNTSTTPTHK